MSELLILQEIMNRIKHEENLDRVPLPCEYFDMIGGTSTGGSAIIASIYAAYLFARLIALILGRLRMSISDAITRYDSLAKEVFHDGRKSFGDGKFKASVLEHVIKQIVEVATDDADSRMMDTRSDGEVCKT
jgi:hypothetical protein